MLSFLALDGGNRFVFWCCGSEMAAGQSYFWPFLQRPHPVCQENIFHRSSSAPKTLNQFPASAASPLICATFLELYILFMRFINILICNNNNKKSTLFPILPSGKHVRINNNFQKNLKLTAEEVN